MLRRANADDAERIFSLLGKVYQNHSMLNLGVNTYKKRVASEEYYSFIYTQDNKVVGHAGISDCEEFAIINSLVVDPSYRKMGLGRQLFDHRLNFCENLGVDHIVGYSMMQHSWSQALYGEGFHPIGMVINYPDIYANLDSNLNKGASNAEMVLCKSLLKNRKTVHLGHNSRIKQNLIDILDKIDLDALFDKSYEIVIGENRVFLGLNPNADYGLIHLAFIEKGIKLDFSAMLTTNNERYEFKEGIRRTYEG